ncbi:hypothetical protein Pukovnik_88 [Mycobacterium phage Pukovnik]|uniref:Uncharacterized protein n=1 Tax=Mycobacterium phage Pukovnik TaxID=2914013 RepID=B3VGN7_9CAUD|nr:hypothetical protein Pukovnik_88 [Mycobacterium phage Pukovnik]ACE80014.1 hypothetical protein Pukovnik_88 [Mycobacterium phage Pukovnik]
MMWEIADRFGNSELLTSEAEVWDNAEAIAEDCELDTDGTFDIVGTEIIVGLMDALKGTAVVGTVVKIGA